MSTTCILLIDLHVLDFSSVVVTKLHCACILLKNQLEDPSNGLCTFQVSLLHSGRHNLGPLGFLNHIETLNSSSNDSTYSHTSVVHVHCTSKVRRFIFLKPWCMHVYIEKNHLMYKGNLGVGIHVVGELFEDAGIGCMGQDAVKPCCH